MVDKVKPEATDSIAQKSSEELFLRGSGQDEALRKKGEEETLNLDDAQEELSLQNIQRGSEQSEYPNTGTEQTGAGASHNDFFEIKSESDDLPTEFDGVVANQSKNAGSAGTTGFQNTESNARQAATFNNSDQDSKRVLFNGEAESGQQEQVRSLFNTGESRSEERRVGKEC